MFVINSGDQIECVAASPEIVKAELNKLFDDIELLLNSDLNPFEVFYYASMLHLVFVKIHPFKDGNGRTVRIGHKASAVQLVKNYYMHLKDYYANIRKTFTTLLLIT